jgi:hypothetical protein
MMPSANCRLHDLSVSNMMIIIMILAVQFHHPEFR